MLELGALDLAAGEPDEAEAHYRRAARWGSSDAVAVLEALGKPVPSADLLWSKERLEMQRRNRIRELGRTDAGKFDPDEFLNRKLDYYAAQVEDD